MFKTKLLTFLHSLYWVFFYPSNFILSVTQVKTFCNHPWFFLHLICIYNPSATLENSTWPRCTHHSQNPDLGSLSETCSSHPIVLLAASLSPPSTPLANTLHCLPSPGTLYCNYSFHCLENSSLLSSDLTLKFTLSERSSLLLYETWHHLPLSLPLVLYSPLHVALSDIWYIYMCVVGMCV